MNASCEEGEPNRSRDAGTDERRWKEVLIALHAAARRDIRTANQPSAISKPAIGHQPSAISNADYRFATLYFFNTSRTLSNGIASTVRPRAVTGVAMKIEL